MADRTAVLELVLALKDQASAGLEDVTGKLGLMAGIAGGVLVSGLVAAGGAVASFGNQSHAALRDVQAQLGLTEDQAQQLGDVAELVFADNWYGSIGEATAAVGLLRQQLGDLSDAELRDVAGGVAAIGDTFGAETPEVVAAVKAIRDNFPGTTEAQALDLITSGFQRGLNASGDFLETITEYGTQFRNGGADAGQFFSILESGLGTGVLGTDKAGDLFKEFVVRIQDGSKLTRESLLALGLDADTVLAQLSSGTIAPIDAFNQVQAALRATDDQTLLMQAGVGLLGTQFEDLGADAVLAIDTTATQLEDIAGATETLNVRYTSLRDAWGAVWRGFLVATQPVYELGLDLTNYMLTPVLDNLQQLIPVVQRGADGLRAFAAEIEAAAASGSIFDLLLSQTEQSLLALRGQLQAGAGAVRDGLVTWSGAFVAWLPDAGAQVLAQLNTWRGQLLAWIADSGPTIAAQFSTWADAVVSWVAASIPEAQAQLQGWLGHILGWVATGREVLGAQLAAWGGALSAWIVESGPATVEALATWLTDVLGALGEQLPAFADGFLGWRLSLAQWVLDAIPFVLESLGVLIGAVIRVLGEALPPLIDVLHSWSLVFLDMLAAAIPPILEGVGALVGQVLDALGAALPGIIEALARWAGALVEWVIAAAPDLLAQLMELSSQLFAWIVERAPLIAEQLGQWAIALIGWVGETAPRLIDSLGEMFGLVLAWIIDNGPMIRETLANWSLAFVEWAVTDGLPALGGALVSIAAGLWGSIQERFVAAFAADSVGGAILASIRDGILAGWDSFTSWFLDLLLTAIPGGAATLNAIGGALGGSQQTRLPGFASGVTDFAGGLAYVHAGELLVNMPAGTDVVPAPSAAEMLGGGRAGSVVIEKVIINGVTDLREAAVELRDELNRLILDTGGVTI